MKRKTGKITDAVENGPAADRRRLASGEATPEELQQENAIVQSAADILHVDFSPKGTPEQWARIIQDIEQV